MTPPVHLEKKEMLLLKQCILLSTKFELIQGMTENIDKLLLFFVENM
jgi:hypothetical protein